MYFIELDKIYKIMYLKYLNHAVKFEDLRKFNYIQFYSNLQTVTKKGWKPTKTVFSEH